MFRKSDKRGQSTLEYVIILTVIVTAIVAFVASNFKKDNSGGLGKLMNQSADKIKTASTRVGSIAE